MEQETIEELDKMKYFDLTIEGTGYICSLEEAIKHLRFMFDEETEEDGYDYSFKIVEMTEQEFKALPEFEGW